MQVTYKTLRNNIPHTAKTATQRQPAIHQHGQQQEEKKHQQEDQKQMALSLQNLLLSSLTPSPTSELQSFCELLPFTGEVGQNVVHWLMAFNEAWSTAGIDEDQHRLWLRFKLQIHNPQHQFSEAAPATEHTLLINQRRSHENGNFLTALVFNVADTAPNIVEKITNLFTTNNDEKIEDHKKEDSNNAEQNTIDVKQDAEEHGEETRGYTFDER
ncbi:unnamed protein product [Didymodactylos carnosus]|uniref:Uncharacterized protein n=1 Tax=Didymodactylos carnosus TaxID=1234261 RepID=A0A815FGB5_9BILA|nr:unnamed protein product [Didymodactylos carnosus]CAF4179706.1 unnamed protein product [Didymodactylos carnosus]